MGDRAGFTGGKVATEPVLYRDGAEGAGLRYGALLALFGYDDYEFSSRRPWEHACSLTSALFR